MLGYCWAHFAYHLANCYTPMDRSRIKLFMYVLTAGMIAVQVYVVFTKNSGRYCEENLLLLGVAHLMLSALIAGFTWALMAMMPVSGLIKLAFHLFGLALFVVNVFILMAVLKADACKNVMPELYWMLYTIGVAGSICSGLVVVLAPFWLSNWFWPRSTLDVRKRKGVCYEPVSCCPCVWHV